MPPGRAGDDDHGDGGIDPRDSVTAVILAGGMARRMGGRDKGLIEVAGRPMVAHVADALRPQVATVICNANRNADAYAAATGCPVFADAIGEYAGPLAGVASALGHAATPWLLSVPCDSPLLDARLAARLLAGARAAGAEIAVAHDGERMQPVFALISAVLTGSLVSYLEAGEAKIDRWFAHHRTIEVDFSDAREMFVNVNTPDERDALEARLAGAA